MGGEIRCLSLIGVQSYETWPLSVRYICPFVHSCYPGILYGCQMDFVKDWPQYALEGEASHYLKKYNVLDDISEQTRYVKRHL